MVLLVLILLPSIALCCDDGWIFFNGNCYQKMTRFSIAQAETTCITSGGHIASIENEEEKQFLMDLSTNGMSTPLLLQTVVGGYRDSKYGPWKWYDGTPFRLGHLVVEAGTPEPNGLCLYLISDKLVNFVKIGSTSWSDYWLNGRTGVLVPGECRNQAYAFFCKRKDTTNSRAAKMCGEKWLVTGSSCYMKQSEPTVPIGQANEYCQRLGGSLVSPTTLNERMIVAGMTRNNWFKEVGWQTAIGCYRNSSSQPWQWYDGTPYNEDWCFYRDHMSSENCCVLFSDGGVKDGTAGKPTIYDNFFDSVYGMYHPVKCSSPAYQFVCEKKACDLSVSTLSGGICTCNKGFVDITETTFLEANKYRKGEKCVKDQCHVMKDTSVIFMIDSSQSITKAQWPVILNFVKNATIRLPTAFRIGFFKYSTNVSKGVWVRPNWSEKQIQKALPKTYDAGESHTPDALKQAAEMFSADNSKHKIAVLISDGLPFNEKYDNQEEANNATVLAAKELKQSGIRLAVMRMCPKITNDKKEVKNLVRNTDNDFYSPYKTNDCVKKMDPEQLVNIVCH